MINIIRTKLGREEGEVRNSYELLEAVHRLQLIEVMDEPIRKKALNKCLPRSAKDLCIQLMIFADLYKKKGKSDDG